jgi:hypothetical protein
MPNVALCFIPRSALFASALTCSYPTPPLSTICRRGTLRAEQAYEIEVQTSIATKSEQEAKQIVKQQSEQSLKDALNKVGLPEGRFQLQPHLLVLQTSETLWTPTIVAVVCASSFSTPYTHTHARTQTHTHIHLYFCRYVYAHTHRVLYLCVCM